MNISLPAIIDIAIGLIFIYLLLSLFAAEIQEFITSYLQWRAKHLKKSIYRMLGGTKNSGILEECLKGLALIDGIDSISDENNKIRSKKGGL